MSILVTGVNGFVGKHLVRELFSRQLPVIGVGHREVEADKEIAGFLNSYYQCDVTNKEQVHRLPLGEVRSIINLAGLANVGASFDNPDLYMKVNVEVLSTLGKAYLTASPNGRMIAVSTGALYGPSQTMPLSEDSETIKTGSPYALSKLAMEKTAEELRSLGLDCVVTRPFNHIGPGQGLGFLIPDLINKLRDIDPANPEIIVGNLKTIRDYSDVRDIARAYADLATAQNLNNNLYNVCSGAGHSGKEVLNEILGAMKINSKDIKITVDQNLIRPSDPLEIYGDNTRLQSDTGWKPDIAFDQTVKDIVASL